MQKTNETTRIVDVKHLCMSDNVDEAVRNDARIFMDYQNGKGL